MTAPTTEQCGESGTTWRKAASIWLCIAALATILNSLILFKYSRFIDLFVGLSFTQFIDAIFVGMQLEPPGAPWEWTALPALVLDTPFVIVMLVLAVKVFHRKHRAANIAFWLYALDTLVVAITFGLSIGIHSAARQLMWQSATLLAHTVGLLILFRAGRPSLGPQIAA